MPDDGRAITEAAIHARLSAETKATRVSTRTIEIVPFAELLKPNLEARWLVKGVVGVKTVTLIVGPSGCGKTFFALDLVLHVAEGRRWFEHRTMASRVVYVAAEAGNSIINRVAAFAMTKLPDAPDLPFGVVVSPVDLCHLAAGDVDRLIAAIGSADLVVIDTVSRALAGGNENAPDDMGAFVTAMDQLRDALGCSIIAVHHHGKDKARGGRGHSLLHCAVDTQIEVEKKTDDLSVATVTKQRDGPGGTELAFRLRTIELGSDLDGDPVTSCVIDQTDWIPEPESKQPSGQAAAALEVLKHAIATHGASPLIDGVKRFALLLDSWREAMRSSGRFGTEGKFRTAWSRVQTKLVEDGHVETRQGYVWLVDSDNDPPF